MISDADGVTDEDTHPFVREMEIATYGSVLVFYEYEILVEVQAIAIYERITGSHHHTASSRFDGGADRHGYIDRVKPNATIAGSVVGCCAKHGETFPDRPGQGVRSLFNSWEQRAI